MKKRYVLKKQYKILLYVMLIISLLSVAFYNNKKIANACNNSKGRTCSLYEINLFAKKGE